MREEKKKRPTSVREGMRSHEDETNNYPPKVEVNSTFYSPPNWPICTPKSIIVLFGIY